ncbi:NAD(P)/FAD-dependent oxidoreductase [Vibrio caribbeanicus]|uniref:Hydrogen cyanide synthase HcnB n=1 Tax=Vibrio caribbeanicus ATCC BAA-2122 TaxID=796620 RepID=E3BK36_9VIBR|nr:FAD/NAD(P)-binding oxidoreductase [Vibrio caribbeanicus]EFP96421.1 hydrogen cyanide synthase HcnB [Vibrio caribbeanicus ATCC BAA-2122]
MKNEVVIVGGGPAGMSAASELSSFDIVSTVLDEAPKVGGVIYRGPWRKTESLPHLDEKLTGAISRLQQDYINNTQFIHFKSQTRVLGPIGDQQLLIAKDNNLSTVDYDYLLLATGCQERAIPFPGWELPGVMLLGAIQLQIKSGLVRPGNKVLIAGTGPLLVLVACQLHKAGCKIEAIYEACEFSALAKESLAILNRPQQALDGLSMMWYLKKHKIPLRYGWGIVNAEGENQVHRATVAPYNKDWEPDVSQAVEHKVDTVGIGYGFSARSQLAQLIGLDVVYDYMNGTIPITDDYQNSSNSRVYCAGDSAKIAGADAAMLEGKIAAWAIANKIGKLTDAELERKVKTARKTLARFYRFRKGFDNSSYRKLGLLSLPKAETIICRCEQIKREAIDDAIAQGCRDIVTLKMRTRITMGDCQGKVCSHYCYDRLSKEGFEEEQGLVRPRFPLDPIPFSILEEN